MLLGDNILYRNASYENIPVIVEFDKKKVTVEAEAKHVEELNKYIKTLLEELSQPASLEFQYDDKTASYLRTMIKDSKTKVS